MSLFKKAVSLLAGVAAVVILGLSTPSLAQNRAAQCINGYRITHQTKVDGDITGGVVLRC